MAVSYQKEHTEKTYINLYLYLLWYLYVTWMQLLKKIIIIIPN